MRSLPDARRRSRAGTILAIALLAGGCGLEPPAPLRPFRCEEHDAARFPATCAGDAGEVDAGEDEDAGVDGGGP
jgi:hypothetical protein